MPPGAAPGSADEPVAKQVHVTVVVQNEQVVAFQVGRRAVPEDEYPPLIRAIDAALMAHGLQLRNVTRAKNRTVYALVPGTLTEPEVIELVEAAADPLGIGVEGNDTRPLQSLGHTPTAAHPPADEDDDDPESHDD